MRVAKQIFEVMDRTLLMQYVLLTHC